MSSDSFWSWLKNMLSRHEGSFSAYDISDPKIIPSLLSAIRPDLLNWTDALSVSTDEDLLQILSMVEKSLNIPNHLVGRNELCPFEMPSTDLQLPLFTYMTYFYYYSSVHSCPKKPAISAFTGNCKPFGTLKEFRRIKCPDNIICLICKRPVRILERFLLNRETVVHRACLKCCKCGKPLRRGFSKASVVDSGVEQVDAISQVYECVEHDDAQLFEMIRSFNPEDTSFRAIQGVETESWEIDSSVEQQIFDQQSDEVHSPSRINVSDTTVQSIVDPFAEPSTSDRKQPIGVHWSSTLETVVFPKSDEKSQWSPSSSPTPPPSSPTPPPRVAKKIAQAIQDTENVDTLYPDELNPFEVQRVEEPIWEKVAIPSETLSVENEPIWRKVPIPFKEASLKTSAVISELDALSISSSSTASSWNVCTDPEPSFDQSVIRGSFLSNLTSDTSLGQAAPDLSTVPMTSKMARQLDESARSKKRDAPPPPSSSLHSTPPQKPHRTAKSMKRQAPLPPVPVRRQIIDDPPIDIAEVSSNLEKIDVALDEVERNAHILEKSVEHRENVDCTQFVEKWIPLACKKLKLLQEQSECSFLLREKQLNQLHIETEYQIRCILEKPDHMKQSDDVQKIDFLLDHLVAIIDEKSKLVESCSADNALKNRKIDLTDVGDVLETKDATKSKQTLNKLIKQKLKSKLTMKKSKPKKP